LIEPFLDKIGTLPQIFDEEVKRFPEDSINFVKLGRLIITSEW
jgi:hypothetical protein